MKHFFNNRQCVIPVVFVAIVIASLACGLPSLPGKDDKGETLVDQSTQSPEQSIEPATGFSLNGAELDSVTSISDGMPIGLILSLRVTNPKTEEVVVTIPCGLVFEPAPGSDEQPLMVIQQATANIPSGDTSDLQLYLACIDSGASIPESGSTYQVGNMAGGDLEAFAACLCDETLGTDILDFQEMLSVQFAVWMVADNITPENMREEFSDVAGEEIYQFLEPMLEILVAPAKEWLEKCSIDIQP